jgi:ferritin
MTIGQRIQDAINEQIKHELYSAYLYLSMSTYCDAQSLPGCANWLRIQWKEETDHAAKLMEYVNDRGGRVALKSIEEPPANFGTMAELFRGVLEHEQKVTARIHDLYELAGREKDHATEAMLQWFLKEQVEEEKSAMQIVETLKLVADNRGALLFFDRQMAARTE